MIIKKLLLISMLLPIASVGLAQDESTFDFIFEENYIEKADSMVNAFIESFMIKDKGIFNEKYQQYSVNAYWTQAPAIDVVIYNYQRHKGINTSLANKYLNYIKLWYKNKANNYAGAAASSTTTPNVTSDYKMFENPYTDDMCWITLTLLHIGEATGLNTYSTVARQVFDNYIIKRAKEDEETGGLWLPWNTDQGSGPNACTQSPATLIAAKLYQKYGTAKYLEYAKKLYAYTSKKIVKSDGRVEEPPLTYTQGTFGEACRVLYHVTDESTAVKNKYKTLAYTYLNYAFTSGRCTNGDNILRHEGTSGEQSIFKAVLIPYAVNYVLDEEMMTTNRVNLCKLILKNTAMMWKNLDLSRYPIVFCNYDWTKPWTGTDSEASMGAMCSGVSLLENTARMQKHFGVSDDNYYTLSYMVDGKDYMRFSIASGTPIIPIDAPVKEGYTFSGWNGLPAIMPTHDVTVTGSFSINSYTLTYKVDGEIYKTSTVVYGTAITPEAEPTREGYTFSGWDNVPATMPAHDVVVEGAFFANYYTLTYKVDGVIYKTSSVTYGTAITPEVAPTKEGYTFSGWNGLPTTMPAHDVTVTGSFSINSYTLTYKVDGKVYRTATIVYGSVITPEPAPIKEGHTFSGWTGLPTTMPAHDVVVTGSFTVNSYTLTYKVDGKHYKTVSVLYGATINPEQAPTKEGHTFSGWSGLPATMPAHDVVVTGSFTVNNYTLTYMVDGAVYKSLSVAYGTIITPEVEPTKDGHTFSGWSGLPATMPAHDVIVSGSFTINMYKLTYKVDGAVYKSYEIEYASAITPEPAPTKEGHVFSGWSEIPATMPAHDVTVTGSFSINGYTLTYMVDGEIYKTYILNYGTKVTPEPVPTKEGYTFSGWSTIPSTMPAENVTVTGTFTINQYKLTYILEGIEYKSYEVDYDTAIIPESVPVKKGMTFSGWGEVPEKMPAHDVTLTGSYSWSKETLDFVIYQVTDTVSNYASVIGYDDITGGAEILPTIETGGDTYTVNSIDNSAFKDCTGLTSITISSNVTSIGSYAFSGCTSLSSVTIGKGVTVIESYAFYNASPKKVFWLSNTPPNGYQNLVGAVNYVANNRYSQMTNVVVYPYLSSMFEVDGIKYVPVSPSERTCDAIDCAYSIENLNIGETVTNKGITLTIKNIGPYFCYDNTFIKEITINNQGGIGQRAFDGCSVLQTVELGQGITSINNRAFANCTSITEIQIPKKVSTIEDYVFSGCTGLKTVHVDISRYELNLGSNGSNPLFADCPLDSVYIGRDITYPTTSNKGYSPFYRNTTLRLLTIADNETDISAYEFYGCTSLKSVRIGDGMTTISDRAFTGCSSLEYFAFGFNVRTIGKEVFSDCTALSRLISRAIIPPTCGAQALDDINKWECTLIVPQDHIAAYQQADQWKEFFFIEGGDFDDGIGNVKSEIATGEEYYDLQGQKLDNPQKGINIIRYSDGSSRKVLLK